MFRHLSLFLLTLGVGSRVSAIPLYVSTSGQFSASDVAGQLVIPNGSFTLQFVVDSAAMPVSGSVSTLGFDVPVSNFSFILNGNPAAAQPTSIRFNTLANGGLFDLTFGAGLNAPLFSFEGSQVFNGTVAAPTFAIGTFAMTRWTYSDAMNFDVRNPVGATVTVSAVPEASSLLLVICGLGACLAAEQLRRQKMFRIFTRF